MNQLSVKGMYFTGGAIAVDSANWQTDDIAAERLFLLLQNLVLDARQADAGNARRHAREKLGNQRPRQADSFKIITAAIGADDRNAHFRHNLEQALIDCLLCAGKAG